MVDPGNNTSINLYTPRLAASLTLIDHHCYPLVLITIFTSTNHHSSIMSPRVTMLSRNHHSISYGYAARNAAVQLLQHEFAQQRGDLRRGTAVIAAVASWMGKGNDGLTMVVNDGY